MKINRSARLMETLVLATLPVAALLLFTACASKGKLADFHLNPADGDRAVFNDEGLTISSRYLDRAQRTDYLREKGGEALAREIKDMSLSVFLLEVVNRSTSDVIVDPASIRFATGKGPLLSPLSYAHMYMALPKGEGRQAVLQELQGVAFDRPATVFPGERKEGLIFFQRPETVSREVAIAISGLYMGGAQKKAVLVFKAVPVEE